MERSQVPGADETALRLARRERERGVRRRALVHESVGCEVNDTESRERAVFEIGRAGSPAQTTPRPRCKTGDELRLAPRGLQSLESPRRVKRRSVRLCRGFL